MTTTKDLAEHYLPDRDRVDRHRVRDEGSFDQALGVEKEPEVERVVSQHPDPKPEAGRGGLADAQPKE